MPGDAAGGAAGLAGVVASVVLACVFAYAGAAKLCDLRATARGVRELGVPARLTRAVATLLPCVELIAAAMTLPTRTRAVGAALCLALLSAFSVLLALRLRQGVRPVCHCFGRSARPTGSEGLIRNAALGVLAIVAITVSVSASNSGLVGR